MWRGIVSSGVAGVSFASALFGLVLGVPAAHAWVVASLAHALVADAGGVVATETTIARHAEALLGATIDACPAFWRRPRSP